MNWEQWTLIGLSIGIATTAVILSTLSLYSSPNTSTTTTLSGEQVSNVNFIAQQKIDGQSYFFKSITPSSQPLENDLILEDVGNVTIVRKTDDPHPGRNQLIVSSSGAAHAQAFPFEILENENNLVVQSTEPSTFNAEQLLLNNLQISPSDVILYGNKGETGATGDHGSIGIEGEKGCPCLCISAKGSDGQKGEQGLQGPPGENNSNDGKQGNKGVKGETGPDGIQGLPGPVYVFSKYWDIDDDRLDDEKLDPRPADFPQNGDYGLVNDTGKVYLSDGFNLTEVANLSQQYMRGEQGLKGDKGSVKGAVGEKGQPGFSCLVKGSVGPEGFPGVDGLEKGEKGDPNVVGIQGDVGERGNNGDKGESGVQGQFSMVGFEEVTQSTLNVSVGASALSYILTVYNPVYFSPVYVWAWGRSVLDPIPSSEDVKANGTLIQVQVDSSRHGNANFQNSSPRVYFVWHNNTSLSPVLFVDPTPTLTIGGTVEGVVSDGQVNLGLFVDNDASPREITTVYPSEQKSFGFKTLMNSGQEYQIVITYTDVPLTELSNEKGIIESNSVDNIHLQVNDSLESPKIVQYIQVNRDQNHVTVTGSFSTLANSANIYIGGILDERVSVNQDAATFDWSLVSSFPLGTSEVQVELLRNGRVVSKLSPPFTMQLTLDFPPTIRKVTPTEDYDIVEGDLTTAADTLEFFNQLGIEHLLPNTTTEFSGSQWLARIPPQIPRGIQTIFCRARIGSYSTSYSWGFEYNNSL